MEMTSAETFRKWGKNLTTVRNKLQLTMSVIELTVPVVKKTVSVVQQTVPVQVFCSVLLSLKWCNGKFVMKRRQKGEPTVVLNDRFIALE